MSSSARRLLPPVRIATVTCVAALLALLTAIGVAGRATSEEVRPVTAKEADALFDQKHYQEAADAYLALLAGPGPAPQAQRNLTRLLVCRIRLGQFDQAIADAESQIGKHAGTVYEARMRRLTGNLYLALPHWGTRAGGVFQRGQHMQGIQLVSYAHDRKFALEHLQQARLLYEKFDGDAAALALLPEDQRGQWRSERINCLFDLASACARFGIYENQPYFWHTWWGQRDDARAETAGEQDFDEQQNQWMLQRKRPIGLRLDPDGKPIFAAMPRTWNDDLGDDEKLLWLLQEVRTLDTSASQQHAARSWMRQAMLARMRFGLGRVHSYAGMYHDGGRQPLREHLEALKPWELKDDEVIALAGGQVMKVALPPQWDVLRMLRLVASDYPDSGLADEAMYSDGLYLQSRQQYTAALPKYQQLLDRFAKSNWAGPAQTQMNRIRQQEVALSGLAVQVSGGPAAKVQVTHRNVDRIWFIARKVDHLGLLKALQDEPVDPEKGPRSFWQLQSWTNQLVSGPNRRDPYLALVSRYVGAEAARWSSAVQRGEGHREAQATLDTPLSAAGAYLVMAFTDEPAADLAQKSGRDALGLGSSRAVLVLSDLALVTKPAKGGQLCLVTHAVTGEPVANAAIRAVEVWSEWEQKPRRHVWHKTIHELTTDADGLALLQRPRRNTGQLHYLVTAGDRVAWSGMSYWQDYRPSPVRSGHFAFCITDRPVYRPGQTVYFKLWVRHAVKGEMLAEPGRPISVRIHDSRGNKLIDVRKQTDDFGGVSGELVLPDDAALGMYHLDVSPGMQMAGQQFRVEEYKKPEFEVTVTPDTQHARLGQPITAVIKARYYFGAPVTEATVSYKVFREQYTHQYIFPGPWDWLYGPGYGWMYYDWNWFDWWPVVARCRPVPGWWYAWYPWYQSNPVRELVSEGEAEIGPDGELKVPIDTGPALRDHGDQDHRYVVQADVRDRSRRVITGEGAVVATRQAYYAMLQPQQGWYRPGDPINVEVRCLTPGAAPVQVEGIVRVSEVRFGGRGNEEVSETLLKQWKAATDEQGRLSISLRHEKSGQLKITFEAPDAWGQVVQGITLVWVCGQDFDGQLHRFNELELITDKRTYAPGETAHVMVNTKRAGGYVLFSSNADAGVIQNWKMLRLQGRSTVVDVPVGEDGRPNFFVEATTVADLRMHQQMAQICVPPTEAVMDIAVNTDKPKYQPGQKATVTVKALTPDGQPAKAAQIVLTAFDQSLLYIQPMLTGPIAGFFHGQLRYHRLGGASTLTDLFGAWGHLTSPKDYLHPQPEEWDGIWGPQIEGWRDVDLETVGDFSARGGRVLARKAFGMAGSGMAMESAASPMPMAAPAAADGLAMASSEVHALRADLLGVDEDKAEPEAPVFAEAALRSVFADSALWLPALTTDEAGVATATFTVPDNLTTWQVSTWAMTRSARVGEAQTTTVSTKNLLVRLQSPRFFTERDEVVISGNVHNYLDSAKDARVTLAFDSSLLQLMQDQAAERTVRIGAGGEARVDWRFKVLKEGSADLTLTALTDAESDAMKLTIPVLVHGITKQVATTGIIRPDQGDRTVTVELDVPDERRPDLTRLEVQFAPSLIGAMLDALPYCLDYPYGCTEQTMSRFLPAVLTRKAVQSLGIDLGQLKDIRGRLAEVRRIEKGEQIHFYTYADSPVFDDKVLSDIISTSLKRIASMQNGDGGWGWWKDDESSPYLTAYALYALMAAKDADIAVDDGMVQRGAAFLQQWEQNELPKKHWSCHAQHAFSAYVLSMSGQRAAVKPAEGDTRPGDLLERLWEQRDTLNLYGKALLALSMANLKDDRAGVVLRNIMQWKQENAETQVAWFKTPEQGWWYWWNSDIETHAWILRAVAKIDPQNEAGPRIVKWLLNNRRNGYYWRSTRDTTLCVAAMADFVTATGEGDADYTLTLDFDGGRSVKTVKINRETFFTYDNRFVVEGVAVGGGKRLLKITKAGKGALYFNTYLRYFTMEEPITAAGHELKVERRYLKLKRIPWVQPVEGSTGQKLAENRLRYERIELKDGDAVDSGELVQVEMKVSSDNDYTFLAMEDPKPAGMEPVEVRSGGKWQEGFGAFVELRDQKTVFFVNTIGQGEHLLRYRLRAETPGVFHALPTQLYGMYVPELRANSDEKVLRIVDR